MRRNARSSTLQAFLSSRVNPCGLLLIKRWRDGYTGNKIENRLRSISMKGQTKRGEVPDVQKRGRDCPSLAISNGGSSLWISFLTELNQITFNYVGYQMVQFWFNDQQWFSTIMLFLLCCQKGLKIFVWLRSRKYSPCSLGSSEKGGTMSNRSLPSVSYVWVEIRANTDALMTFLLCFCFFNAFWALQLYKRQIEICSSDEFLFSVCVYKECEKTKKTRAIDSRIEPFICMLTESFWQHLCTQSSTIAQMLGVML